MNPFVEHFPEVRLNLTDDTDGDWLHWVVFRDFGTVLWRNPWPLGQGAPAKAWALRGKTGLIPGKEVLFSASVDLKKVQHTYAADSKN